MKKLIMAVAIVCAAVCANAAQYVWQTSATSKMYDGPNKALYTGTAYLFADAAPTAMSTVFAALAAGNDVTKLGAIDTSSVSSGAIGKKTSSPIDAGDSLTAFFVIVDGDNFFVSSDVKVAGSDVGATTLTFSAKTASQAAFKDASKGLDGSGWYSTVPEPTSGLLLLLGMAGLALRRRRA